MTVSRGVFRGGGEGRYGYVDFPPPPQFKRKIKDEKKEEKRKNK